MTTATAFLTEVRSALEKPGGWIKGNNALDSNGAFVPTYSSDACSFCIQGALMRTSQHAVGGDEAFIGLRNTLRLRGVFDLLTAFNNDPYTTHADVLSLIDETIERLSSGAES